MWSAHLLIVEDEGRLLEYLSQGLREEGFRVTGASSAEAAEVALRAGSFSGIVLDLRLPQKDGSDFLRELRTAGNSLPVLILTARDSIKSRVAGLDAGADDYLTKPFSFAELVARLRALLRRQRNPPPQLQIGSITFETVTRRVKRDGIELNLSPKETLLLELLMRNAGETVTRGMITLVLWGESYNDFSNLIEVFVNRLRHKLDDHGPSLIVTVRGVGYAMRER
jgi:two-component system, OmpR family, copper resistance phosphate regulon response regulator CusR